MKAGQVFSFMFFPVILCVFTFCNNFSTSSDTHFQRAAFALTADDSSANSTRGCDGDCPKNYGSSFLGRRFGTVPIAETALNPRDTLIVPKARTMVAALEEDKRARIPELKQAIHDPDPNVQKAAIRALGEIGGPEAAAALGELLTDENRTTRIRAIIALGLTGRAGFPYLLKVLETEPFPRGRMFAASALSRIAEPGDTPAIMGLFDRQDTAARMHLVAALVKIDDADAYRALGRLFGSPDRLIRFYVVNSLADAPPDERALPILISSLGDEAQEVRMWGMFSLERLNHPSSFPIILAALGDEDPYVRKEAAFTLGRLGNKDALPFLRASLNDSDTMVRADAATAIGLLGDSDAIPLLEQLLHEQNFALRIRAAEALFRLDDYTGINVLLEMVDAPVRGYSEEAVRALREISNEDFGRDGKAWRDWWICKEDALINE